MINLKEIRKKLLRGDFSGLLRWNGNKKNSLHPADVAQIFVPLPNETSFQAFEAFGPDEQLQVFPYLDISLQKKIIRSLPGERASFILNGMSSDDRITFYSYLKGVELSYFLEFLDEKNKDATHDALGYPDNSVARILNTEFASVEKELTIAQASENLRRTHDDNETVNVIYVVDKEGKLLDDIPVRRLVLNDPQKTIEEIMDGFVVSLNISDS